MRNSNEKHTIPRAQKWHSSGQFPPLKVHICAFDIGKLEQKVRLIGEDESNY